MRLRVGAGLVGDAPRAARGGRWPSAISDGMSRRRVVAQWMWLIASSLRSARCGLPFFRKNCSSSQVGYSGEQSRRDTAKAPQALAQVAAGLQALAAEPAAQEAGHEGVAGAEHVVDLDRKALADDAVLEVVADRRRHRRCSPSAPRFSTMVAGDSARIAFSAPSASSAPEAIMISSSVPTIRSQSGSTVCSLRRDLVGLDVALEARGVAGEAPEVRPVVDVEHHLARRSPWRCAIALRCAASVLGAREMRAGDHDGARRGDEGLVDVVFATAPCRRSRRGRRSSARRLRPRPPAAPARSAAPGR